MEKNVAIDCPPPVWCETIQELCESLAYFRSYQSGLYSSSGIAISMLINSNEVERECFNWDVIVTHGGGSMALSKSPGEKPNVYRLNKSQTDKDVGIAPLIGSYLAGKPIAVILGSQSNKSITRDKYPFSVLGWYSITHVWSEYDLGTEKITLKRKYFVRKKLRLQRIDHQPYKKWWTLDACPAHADREYLNFQCRTQARMCRKCGQTSPIVYEDGFICFNEHCHVFWMLVIDDDGFQAPSSDMKLNSCFIHSKYHDPFQNGFQEPFSLLPFLNSGSIQSIRSLAMNISRGIHCLECGKLSSREEWFEWSCRNCKVRFELKFDILGLLDILDLSERCYTGLPVESGLLYINPASGIEFAERIRGKSTSIHYYLPNLGEITHFLGGAGERESAESILKDYQQRGQERVNFKRYAFHLTKVQRRFLGNQFQFSSGELYDHTLATDTVSMKGSPPSVKRALGFIKDRTGQTSFNQVSSLLYMQGQRMDWHDDGEDVVVGPVATLTMGSKAQMWFRNKTPGRAKNGPCLKLVLSHGDVLVMWNKSIQRDYQHCIKPEGFRIAVTARRMKILPS